MPGWKSEKNSKSRSFARNPITGKLISIKFSFDRFNSEKKVVKANSTIEGRNAAQNATEIKGKGIGQGKEGVVKKKKNLRDKLTQNSKKYLRGLKSF